MFPLPWCCIHYVLYRCLPCQVSTARSWWTWSVPCSTRRPPSVLQSVEFFAILTSNETLLCSWKKLAPGFCFSVQFSILLTAFWCALHGVSVKKASMPYPLPSLPTPPLLSSEGYWPLPGYLLCKLRQNRCRCFLLIAYRNLPIVWSLTTCRHLFPKLAVQISP